MSLVKYFVHLVKARHFPDGWMNKREREIQREKRNGRLHLRGKQKKQAREMNPAVCKRFINLLQGLIQLIALVFHQGHL